MQEMFASLAAEGRQYGPKLWVSIMAGVVLQDLTTAVSTVTHRMERIVRSIPNTPSKVRELMCISLCWMVVERRCGAAAWRSPSAPAARRGTGPPSQLSSPGLQ